MKILITTDNFLPRWDGIARFLNEIVPRLKGHEVTIIAPDFGRVKEHGLTLVKIPLSKRLVGDYAVPRWEYKKVRAEVARADIIFNQALGPIGVCAIMASKRLGKPIVSFTHSLEWELFPKALSHSWLRRLAYPFAKLLVRFLLNRCTALIVPSEHTADELTWHGVRTPKRVANLGVDTKKFSPGSSQRVRKKLGLSLDAFIVGFHGRLAYEKNLKTLVRAFLRLPAKEKKLLLIGDGVPELKKRLKKRGVKIVGAQANVVPWLQACDLYVMPSFSETTSLAVLEAMACGLPVISSRVGFIQQYIKEGKNGFFFDMRSPYDLMKTIIRVAAMDANVLTTVRKNARQTVVEQFDWDLAAKKIILALKEFAPK